MRRQPHPTEVYLEKAIQHAVAGLVAAFKVSDKETAAEAEILERMASRLGVDSRELDYDADVVDEVTWYPVAEMCVVRTLRHLLRESTDGNVVVSLEALGNATSRLTTPDLADRLSLDIGDLRKALIIAGRSIQATTTDGLVLEMEGKEYRLHVRTALHQAAHAAAAQKPALS